jgi:DNA-binding GntR family transcriptional regulator
LLKLKCDRRPQSLVEVVAESLRSSILDGDLASGEKIYLNIVAQALGVSVIPVREAVRILETEGLIFSLRGRGSWVASLSPKDLKETFEMREMMELAAVNMIEKSYGAKNISLAKPTSNVEEVHCLSFHRDLIKLAGNEKLSLAYENLLNQFTRYHKISSKYREENGITWDQHHREHLDIYGSLKRKRYNETKQRIVKHLSNLYKILQSHLA